MSLKKTIIIIAIFFNCGIAFGQVYKNFKTMDHVYKDWLSNQCDTLYYGEKINPEIIDATINLINSKKTFPLYALYNGNETEPLILTRDEQLYLAAELNKLRTFKWPEGMFPKSKKVSLEYIKSLYPIAINQTNDPSKDCAAIYSFSKPIFFRNATICLYIDQELYSNSSNRLFIQFYQVIKGHWEEYTDIYLHLPGDNENMNAFKSEQTQMVNSILNIDLPNQSLLTDVQLQKFGKKTLNIFRLGTSDSIHVIFPNLNQGKRIIRYLGKSNTFSYEMLGAYFLVNSEKVIDSAIVLNIDWSKIIYIGIEKSTAVVINAKNNSSLPLTFTNLNVIFSCGSRKFSIEFKGLYFIDNEVKITGIGKIIEIKY